MPLTTSSAAHLNLLENPETDGDSSAVPVEDDGKIAHKPKAFSDRRSRSPTARSDAGVRTRSRSPRPFQLHETASSQQNADSVQGDEAAKDIIRTQSLYLRHHLGLPEAPGMPTPDPPSAVPLFFIERAPDTRRVGANCKLPTCSATIEPGTYRIVLDPGMALGHWAQKSDFYHIACFEKIADFSQSDFNKRVQPVTRRFFSLRGLKGSQIIDGDYLCDGGAERLVLEWKVRRGVLLDARDGVEHEDEEQLDPNLNNLLRKAGSATYKHQAVEGMSLQETLLLTNRLAPIESDGAGDEKEWNLFEEYLELGSAEDRDTLSTSLGQWQTDVLIVTSPDSALTDAGKEAKAELGEKARRAIKRLSVVPMPDIQRALFGQGL